MANLRDHAMLIHVSMYVNVDYVFIYIYIYIVYIQYTKLNKFE